MEIKEHMKIVGSDGEHVGTVDRLEGGRIKLTKDDAPPGHEGHHHFIDVGLVDDVEGDIVRLAVESDAVPYEEA